MAVPASSRRFRGFVTKFWVALSVLAVVVASAAPEPSSHAANFEIGGNAVPGRLRGRISELSGENFRNCLSPLQSFDRYCSNSLCCSA
jgi:hypothetical protein